MLSTPPEQYFAVHGGKAYQHTHTKHIYIYFFFFVAVGVLSDVETQENGIDQKKIMILIASTNKTQ